MAKLKIDVEIDEILLAKALAKSKNENINLSDLIDKALRTEIFEVNFEEKRKVKRDENKVLI